MPVKRVYVDNKLRSYIPDETISAIIKAWGFERTWGPQLGDAWVLLDDSVHIPLTVIPYEPSMPIRVKMGPPTADRVNMFSHELCHVASRSSCHLDEGLCAATINSQTDPYPTEKELDLLRAPVLLR